MSNRLLNSSGVLEPRFLVILLYLVMNSLIILIHYWYAKWYLCSALFFLSIVPPAALTHELDCWAPRLIAAGQQASLNWHWYEAAAQCIDLCTSWGLSSSSKVASPDARLYSLNCQHSAKLQHKTMAASRRATFRGTQSQHSQLLNRSRKIVPHRH